MQKVLQLLTLFTAGLAQIQPFANDSPEDTYAAVFNKTVQGEVKFQGLSNGSIEISVDLSGFPTSGGPFMYHVHEHSVPTSGNCSGTLGHLNPYGGNINATNPAEKEIGDLSGRYGMVDGTSLKTSYVDQYLSLNPDSKAFIGGLAVTLHLHDNTRIACANITKIASSNDTHSISSASEGGANGGTGYSTILMSVLVAGLSLIV